MGIAVLCPSRGNPGALRDAYFSFHETAMDRTSRFIAVVDEDDPAMAAYVALCEDAQLLIDIVLREDAGNMNLALNFAATRWMWRETIIGFVGDDHRFRTRGWDRVVAKVLADEGGGILYGNDLAQGEQLPTQVFISSAIIQALGWMGLPGAKHLYLDNTWKTLGEKADCLIYVPDIVIEHLHPAYGKGEWDENHRRVNAPEVYSHDGNVYASWLAERADADVAAIRKALSRR